MMIIGIPKEIKNNENRVSLTPAGAYALAKAGHTVLVEETAGEGSSFYPEDYVKAGAQLVPSADEVFAKADLIVKVKEYIETEFRYLREDQLVFTYLHLAADKPFADALIKAGTTSIAYETIRNASGALPLLSPMSEVAGRMSVQVGAAMLQKTNGGLGVLLGGVTGVPAAEVVVVGGGNVGFNAAKMAAGLGAKVTVFDINTARLAYIDDVTNGRIKTQYNHEYDLAEAISRADLVIGAVLIPGARAPKVVTEDMVKSMKKGSAVVDVAIDQGGCIATSAVSTTHDNPYFERYGVLHYTVGNMPGAVPRTSTLALSNATLPYIRTLADKGLAALKEDAGFRQGLNTRRGHYTFKAVAEAFNAEYVPAESLL